MLSMRWILAATVWGGWRSRRAEAASRNARTLAVMTMFRLGMTHPERVAALWLVTQVELALIAAFRESVPDLGFPPPDAGDGAAAGPSEVGGK